MIIITGNVQARDETRTEIIKVCVEHSRNSRDEPGCIEHHVHLDCEDVHRIVFVEKWSDAAAVRMHFSLPRARDFVRQISQMAAVPPEIHIYRSDAVPLAALA